MGSGDPAPYALWAGHGDVTLFGAWGPIERGHGPVTRTFSWVKPGSAPARMPANARWNRKVLPMSNG